MRPAALGILITFLAFSGGTAHAQNYPWCAYYDMGEEGGGTNCGFVSYQQCMETLSGIGGFCTPNNTYVPSGRSFAPSVRHRHRHNNR